MLLAEKSILNYIQSLVKKKKEVKNKFVSELRQQYPQKSAGNLDTHLKVFFYNFIKSVYVSNKISLVILCGLIYFPIISSRDDI